MPAINEYKCNKCGFSLPEGWGGYVYVEHGKGKRVPIPHPLELDIFRRLSIIEIFLGILGKEPFRQIIKERRKAGFNSHCICLDCLTQFDLDIGDAEQAKSSWRYMYGAIKRRDERICPYCNSKNVKTVFELIGKPCPRCKLCPNFKGGIIEEIETGWIS